MKSAVRHLAMLLLVCFACTCRAQDSYPSRPVKLVAPFPASGPLDLLARLVALKLGEQWQNPVVVENVTGATGSIGANAVARAAPDGYTLLITVDIPLAMYPAVAKSLPYDPEGDFKPVADLARTDNGLFVNAGLGVSTVGELVALAKKQPGKLTFSSAGLGSPAHFGGELFKAIAGVDMTHVPYKGAAPAMQAAIAGEVSLMFGPIAQGAPHVKSGKLRALAVSSARRSELAPEVPTVAESGFPGFDASFAYAFLAPAATSPDIVQLLAREMRSAMAAADVREKNRAADYVPTDLNPAQSAAWLKDRREHWARVVARAAITMQ
jgi:tripartite-type tricarboxylate transporter receptor subunit TctC